MILIRNHNKTIGGMMLITSEMAKEKVKKYIDFILYCRDLMENAEEPNDKHQHECTCRYYQGMLQAWIDVLNEIEDYFSATKEEVK
jgi:uncharacterized protein YutE (UPF0331/DUF86 family)